MTRSSQRVRSRSAAAAAGSRGGAGAEEHPADEGADEEATEDDDFQPAAKKVGWTLGVRAKTLHV